MISIAVTIGALLMFVWIFLMDSPTRNASGFDLGNKNVRTFIKYVLLFLAFQIMDIVVSTVYLFLIGELAFSDLSQMIQSAPSTAAVFIVKLFLLIPVFFLNFMCFWGEEYGWR